MAFDNLDFKLRIDDAPNIGFLNETPQYLDTITGEHDFNGERVISGILGNTLNGNHFKVTISRLWVNIKNGSLCKYILGDNFQTLGRGETQKAIEKLSDTLHLPIDKATVSRLHVAQNLMMKNPVQVYFNHLGEWQNGNRKSTRAPTMVNGILETLYYHQSNSILVFYDKLKEQRAKGQPIPKLYQNRYIISYEQRYERRLPKAFNVERVTAVMLYSEKFYIDLLDRWHDNYFNINKINDVTINFEDMKGKKDLYNMGILALVERVGGELNLINQIKEAQRSGKLDKMKQALTSACREKVGITTKNECILELDKEVKRAVKFYR